MSEENSDTPQPEEDENKPERRERKPKTQKSELAKKAENILPIWEIIEKVLVSVSIFIPFVFLLIGGIFQVLSLLSIGLPYLRFFSISQLLSDSIIALVGLFIKVIYPLTLGISLCIVAKFILKLADKYTKDKASFIHNILTIISILSPAFILISVFSSFKDGSIYIGIFGLIIPLIFDFLRKKEKKIESQNHFNIVAYVIIFTIVGIYYIIGNANSSYKLTIKSFLPQNNFVNYKRLHSKYFSKGLKDSLLYFNDQYIFIQLKRDTLIRKIEGKNIVTIKVTKKEIQILRFDKFFEEELKKE